MINNLGTPSFELQINFGVLQIDKENSATGRQSIIFYCNIALQKIHIAYSLVLIGLAYLCAARIIYDFIYV